jgi:hypothetical protein
MNNLDLAESLYKLAIKVEDGLLSDVELCKTREEHIRLMARANEAGKLRGDLQQLVVKLSTTSGA